MSARRPILRPRLLCATALALSVGCSSSGGPRSDVLAARILPSMDVAPTASVPPQYDRAPAAPGKVVQARAEELAAKASDNDSLKPETLPPVEAVPNSVAGCQPLPLMDAIATAFRLQPRLRVFLETVEQARGTETIAAAPFYPAAVAAYSVGGFDLNVGGAGVPIGAGTPNFNFLPFTGAVPVGLDLRTGYELAELKVAWLITDFGKRLGRYRQAELGVDIAQLQTDRAFQTVANEVAVAYYQVLRTRALHRIAEEAVRRADDDLEVAKKLARGGVIEREKVLRAEVQVAQTRRALDQTEAAVGVAVAALNLAIGINVNCLTEVVETAYVPPFTMSLCDCLQEAVNRRREFQVARRSVQVAQEGGRVARADFAPRIVAEGSLADFQQSAPRGHADLALGFIKLEWGLFEGGKRVGELRVADSKVRSAVAQAESISDTIAFQVTEAYRHLVAARSGIDRARPAVEQSRENYRLVGARAQRGDATPSDVIDAESALTRAQQDYLNSIHDYLIALARLEYAMGVAPTPATLGAPSGACHGPP
jgi:outer membrane protein TolC